MSKGGGVNIPNNYTITVGSGSSPLQVDTEIDKIAPITVTSNVAVTQPIVTQSTSKSDSTASVDLKLEPLDIKLEPLDVKIEPLTVDSTSKSEIDLKPVVVDSCQTIRIAPLPPIRVEQPYTQHFGFTYMGMEVWGFTMSGKSEVLVHSPKNLHSEMRPRERGDEPCGRERRAEENDAPGASARPGGGLRVRVND